MPVAVAPGPAAAESTKKTRQRKPPPLTASGIPILTARDIKTKVYVSELVLSTERKTALASLYENPPPNVLFERVYDHKSDPNAQKDTLERLKTLGFSSPTVCPSKRFFRAWAKNKDETPMRGDKKPAESSFQRILYQCASSYDHSVAKSKQCQAPYPQLECNAHFEMSYHPPTDAVLRIRGIIDHSAVCIATKIDRLPRKPVAAVVYDRAIQMLQTGKLQDVKIENSRLFHAREYPGLPRDADTSPYRWLLEPKDTRSIYRIFHRANGVQIDTRAEINIHNWLDPSSPDYKRDFAAVIFHYSARKSKAERFEIAISTPEMDVLSWKYAHQNQFIVDGTFGFSNSRLLLFIAMALDEDRKGVPIALFIFSAPSGNCQSSSGYNTDILTKLFRTWRLHLDSVGRDLGHAEQSFTPISAITDTDLKERAALLQIWPEIWLIICRFHLKQCWRNARNKIKQAGSDVEKLVSDLKARVQAVEQALLAQPDAAAARAFLAAERKTLEHALKDWGNGRLPEVATAVFHHLDYLGDEYWLKFFDSWSDSARVEAARRLGCPVSDVLNTTNHLERFNGELKNTQLSREKRNGRRLRPDVLLNVLVFKVLPRISQNRHDRILRRQQYIRRFADFPGGEELLQKLQAKADETVPLLAYFPDDIERQVRGGEMVLANQIGVPTCTTNSDGTIRLYEFDCLNSMALEGEINSRKYMVQIASNGASNCQCPDFLRCGAACKHCRGARAYMELLFRQKTIGILHPNTIPFPITWREAIELQLQLGIMPGRAQLTVQSLSGQSAELDARTTTEEHAASAHEQLDAGDETDSDDDGKDVSDDDNEDNDSESDMDLAGRRMVSGLDLPPILLPSHPMPSSSAQLPTSAQTLEQQAVARLLFEARTHGNTWGIIADALDSSTAVAALDAEALAVLDPLEDTLRRVLGAIDRRRLGSSQSPSHVSPPMSLPLMQPVPTNADTDSNPRPRKRARGLPALPEVLPPSPEKAQKRQQSYSAT
ncbi:hypothetical protein MIND_01143400 [Mycena indigotica]|uniref:SWIM-type domain-containing protein n=1 Tax=Mycena indigotica TaxID=2126181 RepID=A0A8H6S7J9_9AGAR|nr:uncharacterized protein MIND_01143400 [Mycena indigotica]KAF7293640.1 hypothetical protein MIND_01143400 [Mycena indigotica]